MSLPTFLLVLGYICLYARYTVWSGDFAWGDRYVSTACELAAFISVPLLLKFRARLGKAVWVIGLLLIGSSLIIQLASLAFWLPLEIYQGDDFGHPQWVIWLRFKNIVAFALGKMDAWGLNTDSWATTNGIISTSLLEFLAVCSSEDGRGARVGSGSGIRCMVRGDCGINLCSVQDGRSLP